MKVQYVLIVYLNIYTGYLSAVLLCSPTAVLQCSTQTYSKDHLFMVQGPVVQKLINLTLG